MNQLDLYVSFLLLLLQLSELFNGLKQLVILQFCRSKVQNGLYWVKNQGVGKATFVQSLQEKIHFLTFSSFQRLLQPQLTAPSCIFKASSLIYSHASLIQSSDCLFSCLTLLPPSNEGPCNSIGPYQKFRSFPHLIISVASLFHKREELQVLGVMFTSLEHYSRYHKVTDGYKIPHPTTTKLIFECRW